MKKMTTPLTFEERRAARSAAQVTIDTTHADVKVKAAKLLSDAETAANRDTAALLAQSAKADADALAHVARAIYLQVTPLIAKLLKTETIEAADEARHKYRSFQGEARKYCDREMPLMPAVMVGQTIFTRAPDLKGKIARVTTFGGGDAHCAATQITAAHNALMGQHDPRGVRDAIFALEKRLVEIGNTALGDGDFADEIWTAAKQGLGYYELDEHWRDLCQPVERARLRAAAAQHVPPHKVVYGGFVRNALAKMIAGAALTEAV